MEYYVLINERPKPRFDVHLDGLLFNDKGEITPLYFNKGKALTKKANVKYLLKVKEKGFTEIGKFRDKLSAVGNNANLFVLSDEFAEFMEKEFPNQIEFVELLINYKEEDVTNYKIGNVLQKVECADYENSELMFDEFEETEQGTYEMFGDIYKIDSLAIDHNKVPENLDIFLLEPHKEPIIIVSNRLKEAIEGAEFSGFSFVEPEDFAA